MIIQKKKLIARTLNVGVERIVFNRERLSDINDALTKQDIRDLVRNGAIHVVQIRGRKQHVPRSGRRRAGSVRKKIKGGKREYVLFVRRLRQYVVELKKQGKLNSEDSKMLRKIIRARKVQTKQHIKERLGGSK